MDAFQSVVTEAEKRVPVELTRESFSLEDGISLIESHMAQRSSTSFSGLFTGLTSRRKIITVFLSLLELIRRRRIIAVQADYGDPISLVLNGEPITANQEIVEREGALPDEQ
jgi:chromatin segregation and condensation protein Rec8/ScpA/Scc1 (kleisin family)